KRIAFHEITKNAILEAIENPRKIDRHLVDAQQARRVLDRLVGFELSPVLWKKVKSNLSAGRVQSVAVRLIVEREQDIKKFSVSFYYKVTAEFLTEKGIAVKAEVPEKFASREKVMEFLKSCVDSTFKVTDTETKPSKKSPAPPFTTSTLQQEASRKLSFSVSKTMLIAQQLYESGLITYMRTDSVNLSDLALSMASKEIKSVYGAEYVKTRKYATKSKGAQEAHEAIRPAYMDKHSIEGDNSQKRLYDLIWKRTIASQMSDALLEKTTVNIDVSNAKENFVARGEVLKFDGFLKVYMESTDDDDDSHEEGMLPPMTKGQFLNANEIDATQLFTQHPPRYTEASLVKKLEELGIGRPSTYAPIISTVQKRGYVVNEDRLGTKRDYDFIVLKAKKITEKVMSQNTGQEKSKLFPTDIGVVVTDFLVENFGDILDYNFTASVELQFDEIAQGKKVWKDMIKKFYKPFHTQVEKTIKTTGKTVGERILGVEPGTGKNIYVKIGRFGPIVQIGEKDDENKPRFAGLMKGQSIETITMAEAMELFRLPRDLGKYEEKEMIIGVGRFGPYVRHGSLFYSIPKTDDPLSITMERALEIMAEKKQKDLEKNIKEFAEKPGLKVLKGRWGAYIAFEEKNYRIPKNMDPKALTLDECMVIIQSESQKTGSSGKKPFAKKTAEKKSAPAKKTAAKKATTAKKSTTKKTSKK
ncbi:MAG: type I DNA topoisomerase, partial [Bacteroidota bacterium]